MKFLRCKVCGKIIAMVNDCSSCPTKCCGEAMEEIPVNTQDGAHEKHLPVYNIEGNILKVKVGEVDHPMLEAHYIQWIAVQTDKGNQRKVLQPGQAPYAEFALLPGEKVLAVYEYCNLHGLYKAQYKQELIKNGSAILFYLCVRDALKSATIIYK